MIIESHWRSPIVTWLLFCYCVRNTVLKYWTTDLLWTYCIDLIRPFTKYQLLLNYKKLVSVSNMDKRISDGLKILIFERKYRTAFRDVWFYGLLRTRVCLLHRDFVYVFVIYFASDPMWITSFVDFILCKDKTIYFIFSSCNITGCTVQFKWWAFVRISFTYSTECMCILAHLTIHLSHENMAYVTDTVDIITIGNEVLFQTIFL